MFESAKPLRRPVLYGVGLALLMGCSSAVPRSGQVGEMYEPGRLEEFVDKTSRPDEPIPQYIIGIGDKLDVVFLYHHDLTTYDLVVRPDGKISLPYVGDHRAAGLAPMDLDSLLTVRFAEILKDPTLSVIVKEQAKQRVYVLGEVKAPGGYKYEGTITLVQAIAQAAGLSPDARASHAVIIRRQGTTKIVGIEVNVDAIVRGAAVENDIVLKNEDIVYVPRSRIAGVKEFAKTVKDLLDIPLDVYLTAWQIRSLQASYEFFKDRD
jgi:polysaccharide export outer membrane protein